MPVPETRTPTPRRLIRDEVYLRLMEAIIDCDLLPGEQLSDVKIEQWLGVSRTPIREALNQLSAIGLVEILPQKKTRITPISPDRLHALIELLGTMIFGLIRDTTPLLTKVDKERLSAFSKEAQQSANFKLLVKEKAFFEGFLSIFIRRLDNKSVARIVANHLPELRRALIASPDEMLLNSGIPKIAKTIDHVLDNDPEQAATSCANFWDNTLFPLVEAFSSPKKEEHASARP